MRLEEKYENGILLSKVERDAEGDVTSTYELKRTDPLRNTLSDFRHPGAGCRGSDTAAGTAIADLVRLTMALLLCANRNPNSPTATARIPAVLRTSRRSDDRSGSTRASS